MRYFLLFILLFVMAPFSAAQNLVVNGDFEMDTTHWKRTQWTGFGSSYGIRATDVKLGLVDRALFFEHWYPASTTYKLVMESLPFSVPGWRKYPFTFNCKWQRYHNSRPIQGINHITVWIMDAKTRGLVHFRRVFVPNYGGLVDRIRITDIVQFHQVGLCYVEVEFAYTWYHNGGFPYTAYVDDIKIGDSTILLKGKSYFGKATIHSTSWVEGQPFTITGYNAPANMVGALWLSFRGAGPIHPMPGCEIWIDPARVVAIVPVFTNSSGRWIYTGQIPSLPLLKGTWFAAQVGFYPLSKSPGLETTPGIHAMVNL